MDKNFDSPKKSPNESSKKSEADKQDLPESNIDSKYKEKDIDNNTGSAGGSHSHATPSPDGVNIYSPFQRKGSANSGRKNRYIPEDYTGAQLKEHIEPVIREEVEKCDEFGYTDLTQTTSEIIEVISAFYAKYYVRFRKRHRVLSDEAYRNIVHRYLNAPDEIRFYGPRIYYELIDKYFSTKFNQKGRYDGTVEMSVSHFMTYDILQNLYYQFAKEIGVE